VDCFALDVIDAIVGNLEHEENLDGALE